jgi:transglutaminase/protease-like cytokinesis protein 3
VLLSSINNYVHPYNSYSEIKTIFDDTGEVTIRITHQYSADDITALEYKIDDLFNVTTTNNMDNLTKLKKIHDYVINNTIYDIKKVKYNDNTYDSARMNGILMQGYGICSAYSDLMAVILNRLGIDNFKVSSNKHVWNALNINNEWLHLDATWDDPVTSTGEQIISHDYYLITTDVLKDKTAGDAEHQFDNKYYLYFE